MRTLALDIGTRRTGCALYDDAIGVPLPLDTISHATIEEFTSHISALIRLRGIERLIVGLPLLLSGREGGQSESVRTYASALESLGIETHFLDERYTTPSQKVADSDALSALSILQTYLEKNGS